MGRAGQFWLFQQNFKGPYLGKYFTKYAIIWQIFFSDHIDQMCKFSSKSGGVPFQPLGDLTWNDPTVYALEIMKWYDQSLKPLFQLFGKHNISQY